VFKDKPGGLIVDYIGSQRFEKVPFEIHRADKGNSKPTSMKVLALLKE